MNINNNDFCFCTLALGKEYRDLALLLAEDISVYAPGIPFVILTDKPHYFSQFEQVQSFQHSQKSVGCYQDKVYVISKALSLFSSCMFMDADMRILKEFPQFQWLPGITARSCSSIKKHFATKMTNNVNTNKKYLVVEKSAHHLNLNLQDENIRFVHEFLFVVTRDEGKEIHFLKLWEQLGRFFELNGMYDGEGNTMGLAAAKVGLTIRHDTMENLDFFKDKIERVRIKYGQSEPEKNRIFFEKREEICRKNHPLIKKIITKITTKIMFYYRYINLRLITRNGLELERFN
ncbi:hypothetical protein B6N60_05277 [Richelia sinica FACHB-800]|uniref:Nucleotide-diphospho-sugar transferase domain-containing protein n=1 Tax=Richelia sinica FACHB-800 TaxID=1357546 RepID=A0A975TDC1_9NOST|nr:hypothetical protein [Richelia sinica]MBD2665551.1 hypothetical protein [Richelia sinica FACHB-800]QXE26544.1 hypothetical protein B6N60_05277 [Richelia sinica FACHB-800]